jgi:glycogen debranching enzyme
MSVDIKVGPPVLTINRGSTFMVTDLNGEIDQTNAQGLFAEDTRFISTYRLYINEQPWERVTASAVTYYAARLELTNPSVLTPDGQGTIEQRTIALTLEREIDASLHESFHLVNYSQTRVQFMLELAMRSDFADLFEVKAGRLTRRGHVETAWDPNTRDLVTSYQHADFARRVVYHVDDSKSQPAYANGRLVFSVELDPGADWDAHCEAVLRHQGRPRHGEAPRNGDRQQTHGQRDHTNAGDLESFQEQWLASCTGLKTTNENVRNAYVQSTEDMGALRMPEHDLGPNVWVPAAGVPWFVALFGRDSLIASYQTMMVHAPFATGALRELARYQATERDDWRDAQPGKMPHELRRGELAHFNLVPFTPYYGTADATILYLIVLHEAYKWTGDRSLLEDLRAVAERCLEWIDNDGDLDGDGFQEWKSYSKRGFNNMCWKDSGVAVVYGNGRQVKQPKGTCELQAYVFDAKMRMAEVFDVLGEGDRAKALREQAADLQQRFDEQFWMDDEGCYAFGLDPKKKQIDAVTSNTGQCLWSGIVPPQRAERIVDRLFQSDMWCGWGIRTLSSRNPAYNPYSYQRGAVWPHDNGLIAAGLKRYGFANEVNRIAEGIFAATSFFESFRLPEVFSGLARRPSSFPAQYIGANIPQAWAAGSILHLLRTILGLRADAPSGTLYVNPTLPDWLPELELQRLKVGNASLDLRFWREDGNSKFAVEAQRGGQIEVKVEGPDIPVPSALSVSRRGSASGGAAAPAAAANRRPRRSGSDGQRTKLSSSEQETEPNPRTERSGAGSEKRGEDNPLDGGAPTAGNGSEPAAAQGRPKDSTDQRRAQGS